MFKKLPFEVKETPAAALDEMQAFLDTDLTKYATNTFDRDNHIFHQNLEVASREPKLKAAAIEKSNALARKLVAMINANLD